MLSRANDPILTPAQAANISGGFAPAAGFADVLGLYPAFPDADMTVEEMAMGPRSPSLMQNVMEGNLLDSALQIAGLLPVVGGGCEKRPSGPCRSRQHGRVQRNTRSGD